MRAEKLAGLATTCHELRHKPPFL